MHHDVAILGGGPAGLAAALALGRARRTAVVLDAGPPRNAAATHVHNLWTRDGTPPAELRRIGREQAAHYPTLEVRDGARVTEIAPLAAGGFGLSIAGAPGVTARRVLLATGMIDELPPLPGFAALWGTSIFQCPYCHGYEVADRRFAVLATAPEMVGFALMLRAWTADVVVLTAAAGELPDPLLDDLARARVAIEPRPLVAVHGRDGQLTELELAGGGRLARDVLFARPPQRQPPVVAALGLAVDALGYVAIDMMGATSRPGVFAAGDLTTPRQAAAGAAAAGTFAAAGIVHGLIGELVREGIL